MNIQSRAPPRPSRFSMSSTMRSSSFARRIQTHPSNPSGCSGAATTSTRMAPTGERTTAEVGPVALTSSALCRNTECMPPSTCSATRTWTPMNMIARSSPMSGVTTLKSISRVAIPWRVDTGQEISSICASPSARAWPLPCKPQLLTDPTMERPLGQSRETAGNGTLKTSINDDTGPAGLAKLQFKRHYMTSMIPRTTINCT